MCPSAYGDGQKFKHGLHGEHGFDFFTDLFSWQMVIGFVFRFSWILECLWHSLSSEKHQITFYRIHHPIIHQEGSAPALANPAESKIKSKYH